MPQTWIAEEGLTGLADRVSTISDDVAGARRRLAGSGSGDLGGLNDRYAATVDRCLAALQTARAAASESAEKIGACEELYRETDGAVELWFHGLET